MSCSHKPNKQSVNLMVRRSVPTGCWHLWCECHFEKNNFFSASCCTLWTLQNIQLSVAYVFVNNMMRFVCWPAENILLLLIMSGVSGQGSGVSGQDSAVRNAIIVVINVLIWISAFRWFSYIVMCKRCAAVSVSVRCAAVSVSIRCAAVSVRCAAVRCAAVRRQLSKAALYCSIPSLQLPP